MATVTTKTGKTHEVEWHGVSTMTGTLYFLIMVKDESAGELIAEFDNAQSTQTLTFDDGHGSTESFEWYTSFASLNRDHNGNVQIGLKRT